METEAPDADVGRVDLRAHVLLRTDGHAHVGRRRGQAGGDQLQVQHVVVLQGLDGIAHHILHDECMLAVAAQAPADLAAVARVDDAAAAGLLPQGPVGVPLAFVDILQALLVADPQAGYLDVSEVLAGQIPLRPLIHVDIPYLADVRGAVPAQPDGNVHVGHLRGVQDRRPEEQRRHNQE